MIQIGFEFRIYANGSEGHEIRHDQVMVGHRGAVFLIVLHGHLDARIEFLCALLDGGAENRVVQGAIGLALQDLLGVLDAGGNEQHIAGNAPGGNPAAHASLIHLGLELLQHIGHIRLMAGHIDVQGGGEGMEGRRATLEGVNGLLLKDLPDDLKEEGAMALAAALLKFFVASYLFNDLYELVAGRRPAFDPIDMVNELIGDTAGYQLPNTFEEIGKAASGTASGEDFTTEHKGVAKAVAGLGGSIAEQTPFVVGTDAVCSSPFRRASGEAFRL